MELEGVRGRSLGFLQFGQVRLPSHYLRGIPLVCGYSLLGTEDRSDRVTVYVSWG